MLQILFFNLREVKLKLQGSARLLKREMILLWEKVGANLNPQ